MVVKQEVAVPKFRNTREAVAFGLVHFGDSKVIQALREAEDFYGALADRRLAEGRDFVNEANILGVQASLYREAREVAEGKHQLRGVL